MTRIAALLCLLLAAGCASTQAVSSGNASPADVRFATNAAQIIKFDQDECTLAQTQATSPEVRAFAAKLLEEANDFQAKLIPAASQAGITLPETLSDMRRIRLAHMHLQHGLDFDRTFLDDQIESHQDAIDTMQAIPAGDTSPLARLAGQGEALVGANLTRLRMLQQQLQG